MVFLSQFLTVKTVCQILLFVFDLGIFCIYLYDIYWLILQLLFGSFGKWSA